MGGPDCAHARPRHRRVPQGGHREELRQARRVSQEVSGLDQVYKPHLPSGCKRFNTQVDLSSMKKYTACLDVHKEDVSNYSISCLKPFAAAR